MACSCPVAGTVARGHLPLAVSSQEEAAALVNPLPRTEEVLRRWAARCYRNHCVVCHGAAGQRRAARLTRAYGAKPANLLAQQFRDYPDGKIYWAIVKGKNAMPAYAADLTETTSAGPWCTTCGPSSARRTRQGRGSEGWSGQR